MSFTLTNVAQRYYSQKLDVTTWTLSLHLAMESGWKPSGSKRPPKLGLFKKWQGFYDTKDGQIVTADDALNFASALETLLESDDFEEKCLGASKRIQARIESATGIVMDKPWGGCLEREAVKDLIQFLRSGSFSVN